LKTIISRQNPEIISVAKLANAKEREKQQKFIAEGLRTCSALVQSSIKLAQLYVTEAMLEEAKKITTERFITVIDKPVMEKISISSSPSGMVGVFHIPPTPEPKTVQPGLVLASISDPGNMGTLIRTAAALNIKSVVIVEGVDIWNPKVIQATAGTIGNVSLFQWSWDELIRYKGSKKLYPLVISGGKNPSNHYNDGFLVVGSEAHGIPQKWLNNCNDRLTIPMPGNTESLNAAVAGSIALYLVYCPQ